MIQPNQSSLLDESASSPKSLVLVEIEYEPGEVNTIHAAAAELGLTTAEFIQRATRDFLRGQAIKREQPEAPLRHRLAPIPMQHRDTVCYGTKDLVGVLPEKI